MAAAGGSYGGFLVNWIAGHTDRFKALVSHAGVYSLLGQSASDTSYGRQHSYGGYPFTNLANVERWSPNRFAADFQTPMLVPPRRAGLPRARHAGARALRRAHGQGRAGAARVLPRREPLDPEGPELTHWYGEVLGWLAKYLKPDAAAPVRAAS